MFLFDWLRSNSIFHETMRILSRWAWHSTCPRMPLGSGALVTGGYGGRRVGCWDMSNAVICYQFNEMGVKGRLGRKVMNINICCQTRPEAGLDIWFLEKLWEELLCTREKGQSMDLVANLGARQSDRQSRGHVRRFAGLLIPCGFPFLRVN